MGKFLRSIGNLKTKLIISFLSILIIPSIFIGLQSYSTAKNAVKNEMLNGFEKTTNVLNLSIDNSLKPKMHDVEYFAKNITLKQFKGENSLKLGQQFDEYAQLHPEILSIYVGSKTGALIQKPDVTMPAGYNPSEEDWYKAAMDKQGEIAISEPYQDAGSKEWCVTISQTIKDGSGVVAVDIYVSHIQELINKVKLGNTGYAFLLDQNRKYIAHPTMKVGSEAKDSFNDQMYQKEQGNFVYVFKGKEKVMEFTTNKLTGWKIAGSVPTSEINDAAAPIFLKTFFVILIALIIGAIVIFFIIKSILSPLRKLKENANTISKGDLTKEINVQSNDEIGQLAKAFQEMRISLIGLVKEVDQNAEQVAASAEELTASAEQTSAATEQVSTAIQEVSSSAEKQTDGINKNSESLQQVSQGVTQIAENSMKVTELAYHTTMQAEEGGKAVTNTVNQMNSIHESVLESNAMIESLNVRSKEVNSILDVITGIADQTNLLALNAAIEAARAGEHGKGFAVVADEVRKLAEQSQQSAIEIHEIVEKIQKDTKSSVQIMARVTDDVQTGVKVSTEAIEKFNQILQSTKEMTPQMEDVSAIAQQMSASIQEISATAHELSGIAEANAATSEEVAASTQEQLASMEEISSSAQSLSSMAENLKQLISKFKY
ncbi:methyl-accepting chemotaxis protein [Rummeliibacillus pycnus]|uniref:methyl-accepting chemotaxis protein n=1 Tax=Rummeliibacillus pycnus TaxID=101070 RepID=UPI003D2BCEC1